MLPTERIAYSAIAERPPLKLPGGARMAVWVIVNVEEWDPKQHDAAHGADAAGRRLADARHPELGLARIRQPRRLLAHAQGVRRVQDSRRAGDQRLRHRGLSADRARRRCERNWEFMGHGFTQRNMQKVPDERADIRKTTEAITKATGKPPRGWLGPGLTETWETPDLLVEDGYDYVADWVLDDQPVWLKTRGKPIVNIPYTQECNDVAMMLIQHHKASEYYDRAIDQFEQIYADAEDSRARHGAGGASLHHGRAAPAEILPQDLREHPEEAGRAFMTGEQILDWYLKVGPEGGRSGLLLLQRSAAAAIPATWSKVPPKSSDR